MKALQLFMKAAEEHPAHVGVALALACFLACVAGNCLPRWAW